MTTVTINNVTRTVTIAQRGTQGPPGTGAPGGGAALSNANPAALGTPAPGTGAAASREDHVHPLPMKAEIGLGAVDNTADADKPVSTPQATAIATAKGEAISAAATDATNKANAAAAASVPTTALGVSVATLVGGVMPTSQIPAVAITEFLGSTASQAAMLALVGQKGDWTIRTDVGKTFVITGNDPTQLADWTALSYPGAPVVSVNGQTGAVVLGYADVGADAAGAAAAAQAAAAADATTKANAAQAASEPTQTAATQAEAEAGTEPAIRKFSPLRIAQAIAAWWAASAAKLKLDSALQPITVGTPSSSSGTLTLDFAGKSRAVFAVTLTQNVTTVTLSNLPSGVYLEYEIHYKQNGTGGYTVAQPASHKATGGSDTAVASAANAVTVLSASSVDGGTTWRYAMQESA